MGDLLLAGLLINLPVGVAVGAVSRLYPAEALGALLGGVAFTLVLICASDQPGQVTEDAGLLERRYLDTELAERCFPGLAFHALLPREEVRFVRRQRATGPKAINLAFHAEPFPHYRADEPGSEERGSFATQPLSGEALGQRPVGRQLS